MRTIFLAMAVTCLAGLLPRCSQAEPRIVDGVVSTEIEGEEHYRIWSGTKFTYVTQQLFEQLERGDCLDANWIDSNALSYAKPMSVLRPFKFFGVPDLGPPGQPIIHPLRPRRVLPRFRMAEQETPEETTEQLPPPADELPTGCPERTAAIEAQNDTPTPTDEPTELVPTPLSDDFTIEAKRVVRLEMVVFEADADYKTEFKMELRAWAADDSYCKISILQYEKLQLQDLDSTMEMLTGVWIYSV